MRTRWRAERDRSDARLFDLKQGAGALLDIEFLLQALVLIHSHAHSNLLDRVSAPTLIGRARHAGLFDARAARTLADAHTALLSRALSCTLDARPRVIERDGELQALSEGVRAICAALVLAF